MLAYVLSVIELHDRRYAESREYVRDAVEKAERTMNERLTGMNEFRDTLRDQAAQFVSKPYLEATLQRIDERANAYQDSIETRLKSLENNRANLEGRMWALGAAFTIINIIIAVASFVLPLLSRTQ